ncbi:toll/interleukin-1 receptor domain-containing protein [Kitasatospora sp. NPDC096140]|uniref:toll/interleukin-1 receptor domain-containing protein n=1 Tax=Kitasatospora sp. NPDC096140 TaxID=3155425 RepID=UPI00331EFDE6
MTDAGADRDADTDRDAADRAREQATRALLAEYAAGAREFTGRTFTGLRLGQENLSDAVFVDCEFDDCILALGAFDRCEFRGCRLRRINAIQASFIEARFLHCDLEEAAFRTADFFKATFRGGSFGGNYREAFFVQAVFDEVTFLGARFDDAHFGFNVFSDAKLVATTLDPVVVDGLCRIDERTISTSFILNSRALDVAREQLHDDRAARELTRDLAGLERFFVRAGADPDTVRAYRATARGGREPARPSVFISYSAADESFATELRDQLEANGVDTWFAPHDIRGGRTILEQVTEEIQRRGRMILVLSEASMASNWVATEIGRAVRAERESGTRKLFPIRIVPHERLLRWELFDADAGYDVARTIREYYIPDFCDNGLALHQSVSRLVRDLREG